MPQSTEASSSFLHLSIPSHSPSSKPSSMSSTVFGFLDHVPAAIPPPVFVSFMISALLMRIYVRLKIIKTWAWDDVACIIAALASLSHTILHSQMIKVGFGRHLWDIPASWLLSVNNTRLISSNGVTNPIAIYFAKLSILLLYRRIFSISRTLQMIVYGGIVLMTCFYAAMVGAAIKSMLTCTDVQQLSLPFCQAYKGPIILLNSAFNVVTDFWILILPFPLVAKLRLRFRQKLGVVSVFAAGAAACAASLARLIVLSLHYHDPDVFWIQATNAMFTIVEINIAIVVACVSCFPSFYAKLKTYLRTASVTIRNRLLSSSKGSSRSSKSNDREHKLQKEESPVIKGGYPRAELYNVSSSDNPPYRPRDVEMYL